MKYSIIRHAIILFFPLLFISQNQNDTIFRKEGSDLICKITAVDDEYITFNIGKLKNRYIHKENVVAINYKGKRELVKYLPPIKEKKSSNFKETNQGLSENSEEYGNARKDTVYISQEIDFMKACLRNCHKEYTAGLITFGSGFIISSIGVLVSEEAELSTSLLVVGGVATIVGAVLMLDSHKWINRAGFGINGRGNEVSVYYRFK